MRVCAVVPVSLYEPESLIKKSIECLQELTSDNFMFEAHYIVDTAADDQRNFSLALPPGFKIILRENNHGARAGAINDFLSMTQDVDYIAIFDIDSRPEKDFIVKCLASLQKNSAAVLSSGCRYVTNNSNVLTKIVSIEYIFFCSVYRLCNWTDGFLQFNGLIGLLKGSFIKGRTFDEGASCEDLDLTERIYLSRHVAVLAKTAVGEQAPTMIRDLYSQRVRWLRGAVEGQIKYLMQMMRAPIPFSRKITWFASMTLPFFAFLLSPLVVLYVDKIARLSATPSEFVKIFVGTIAYTWLMSICGVVALIQHLMSSKPEWKSIIRSDV